MKKTVLAVVASLLLSAVAGAVELRLGHIYEPSHPWHVGMIEAAKIIKEKSNGRINVSVFPSGTLGTEQELMEQAITGGLDIAESGAGQLANVYEVMTLTEMPYLFRDNAHVMQFVKSPKFAEIGEDFHQEHGAYIVGASTWGIRHIIGNKAIRTPADLAGFKLRVPDQRITVGYARAMGANPTPIAYSEAYLALQQNAVDGLENPLVSIQSMRFYEVAKTLSLTAHVTNIVSLVMNGDSYDALPAADQKILRDGMAEGCEIIYRLMVESDNKLVQFFKDQGLTVVEVDRQAFGEKTKSMSDEYAKNWAKFGDLYKYIQDLK
ncbi:MAG: sialic acid TRAP transporter substrate-binding protein SiaP [Planctomycetota bacterium]|jgi:tripartite ATP-independent transporter DctP family solute receptor|nr:sialic acid TRAP transporter substrate-binding protein SiaP [Planctomycetota bacterium]